MPSSRIVYQDWIVELGRDPALPPSDEGESERGKIVEEAVETALKALSDNEREFIQRFHYMGQTYRQISESTGRTVHRLEALHRRATKRLRKELAPLVLDFYGVTGDSAPQCIICRSDHRREIDRLIADRKKTATWRPVIREIRKRYGLRITTPQTLIGHEKYHIGR